jgi:hypothetical protein
LRKYGEQYDEVEVLILQTGDFGFWPHKHGTTELSRNGRSLWDQYGIKNEIAWLKDGLVKVYWCAGNHENHDALDALEADNPGRNFLEIMPGINFAVFGSILRLLDGTRVLFAGGADSTDKSQRVPGDTWWPQEQISMRDMQRLPEADSGAADWVISHTCPTLFHLEKALGYSPKNTDRSKTYLDSVFESFRPKRWWFGHYHDYCQGFHAGCRWTLLDMCGNTSGKNWVEALPLITKCE